MATDELDASLRTLRQSVTNRLSDEERFKREVYDKINVILRQLNVCASGLASSPAPAIAAAGVDLTEQLRALNVEVGRLQSNRLTNEDSEYVTQPLRTEASFDNLKWNTDANKTGFRPQDYRVGPSVGPPPPYTGPSSSRPSLGPSSRPPFPRYTPSFEVGSSLRDGDADGEPDVGGWSPRRPRRTPRQSPKKKTYRR